MSAHPLSTDPFVADPSDHALRRLGLAPMGPGAFPGAIASVISVTDARFARITCGAARLICRMAGAAGDLWLILPLDSEVVFGSGARCERVPVGDIGFGAMDTATTFTCEGGARLLFVCLPGGAPAGGLGHLSLSGPRILRAHRGIARILAALLRAVSDTIEQLDPKDARPLELACARLLSAALGCEMHVPLAGSARMGREGFQRLCRIIEQRLGDPGLSLVGLAQEEGVSTRYLQKMFERAGERFGHYVRTRRLERCRADLADPALTGEAVASIGFRWGFTDAAHFSRAFRDRFGIAPRAYRLSTGIAGDA